MSPSKFLKKRQAAQPPKPKQKPPIAERYHWREELRLQARHVHAGDAFIDRSGRQRRFLPIVELGIIGDNVTIKCKDLKATGGYVYHNFKARDRVEVRRTFHD